MSKALICVGVVSILLIGTFILMIFLMLDINPAPIENSTLKSSVKKWEDMVDTGVNETINDNGIYRGLIKLNKTELASLVNLTDTTTASTTHKANKSSTANTTLVPLVSMKTWVNNTNVSNTTEKGDVKIRCHAVHKCNNTHNETTTEETIKTVKSRRRSVDNVERKISGPVVLKILDESGDPRMQIKLEPVKFFYRPNNYRSSMNKVDSTLDDEVIVENEINNLNDTEIIIMANNSVVFIEDLNSPYSNQTKVGNHIIDLNVSEEETNLLQNYSEKIIDNIVLRPEEYVPSNQILALKLLFNNETKLQNITYN